MSQNANPTVFETSEQNPLSVVISAPQSSDGTIAHVPESSAALVESDAERLMDEIFEEVERILKNSTALPLDTAEIEPASQLDFAVPQLKSPSMLIHRPAVDDGPTSEETLLAVGVDGPSDLSSLSTKSETTGKSPLAIERLLLLVSCAAVLAANVVGFAMQNRLQQAAPVAVAPAETQISQADQEFLNYIQRSLEVIDRKTEINRQTTALAGSPTSGSNLPTVPVPGAPSQAGSTVLERVYIPVYQPPQVAAVPGAPLQVAPMPPATIPNAPQAGVPSAMAPVPNIAPATSSALIGVLELGDRSAALFEINGSAQRVQLGEAIGNTGWTLAAVKNQEAIVRRNGEVRSINIGQRF